MELVKACLCMEKTVLLSASKDLESSFHHCGSPVMLMQACVCAGKT